MHLFVFVALTLAAPATGQTATPAKAPLTITGAINSTYQMARGWILKSADMMSEENYKWQPTPEVRTFGRLIAHIADDNNVFCGSLIGGPISFGAVEKALGAGSKADLKKALEDSFVNCDKAFALGEEKLLSETASGMGGVQPKLGLLAFNNAHIMEHYGNIITYMRLKGLVPPSSGGK
jgi:hypothetical protein